ncbi:MAG: DUF2235 domain-containing protein [Pseudomonadota bacterium]
MTSRNIVICSDGTGNTALKGRGTNVFKLYEAVNVGDHQQIAIYDDGVGTESLRLVKVIGGAFGYGLSRNVRQLYMEICRAYRPGDQLFMFGFSRGAFTVRTLAGLVVQSGIIDPDHWTTDAELEKLVGKAYRAHRQQYQTWLSKRLGSNEKQAERAIEDFRGQYGIDGKPGEVRFLGVWDTVDAVGLPFDHLADFINEAFYRFKFPDTRLDKHVHKACHAIAIDDERHTFHPVMWDESDNTDGRIEQVWFAGAHSNVGGGYEKQGLSLVALDWMMHKAEQAGLRFIGSLRQAYHDRQNVDDKLFNSRRGLNVYYRYKPRDIAEICDDNGAQPKIHVSAVRRLARAIDGYAPGQLPENVTIVPTMKPGPGEDRETLKKAEDVITSALRDHSDDLETAGKWIRYRRFTHYAFLLMSILVFVFAYVSKDPGATSASASKLQYGVEALVTAVLPMGGWLATHIVQPLFTTVAILGFAILGIAFFVFGKICRDRLSEIYQRLWRPTWRRAKVNLNPIATSPTKAE